MPARDIDPLAPQTWSDTATLKFDSERTSDGVVRPVIHILMSDGRVTEFRHRGMVVPELPGDGQAPNDGRVYAVLVDSNGVPYQTPDGEDAIVDVPVLQAVAVYDPEEQLSWKDVARRANVSLSSVKRAAGAGDIPKPQLVPGMERAVRFKAADVAAWINGGRHKAKPKR